MNLQFYQQHKPYLGVQKQLYIHGHFFTLPSNA